MTDLYKIERKHEGGDWLVIYNDKTREAAVLQYLNLYEMYERPNLFDNELAMANDLIENDLDEKGCYSTGFLVNNCWIECRISIQNQV